jgi:hypothetical protein
VTGERECRHSGRSMPSCRHTTCDGTETALTSRNASCDGCDGTRECRHNSSKRGSGPAESRRVDDAVTGDTSRTFEISSSDGQLTVRLPSERPVLTRGAARVLLGILVQLTTVDEPGEEVDRDC